MELDVVLIIKIGLWGWYFSTFVKRIFGNCQLVTFRTGFTLNFEDTTGNALKSNREWVLTKVLLDLFKVVYMFHCFTQCFEQLIAGPSELKIKDKSSIPKLIKIWSSSIYSRLSVKDRNHVSLYCYARNINAYLN